MRLRRVQSVRAGAVLSLLLAATVTSAALAAPGLPASYAGSADIRAVVTLRSTAPVTAPGVRVVSVMPRVGVEVVRGTPAAIRSLAADPRVAGVAPDDQVQLSGHDHSNGKSQSVFAWQGLDNKAGKDVAGGGVTVAVLDTGVSDTPALNRASARLVDGVDTSRLASGGDARTTGTFTDGYGHGTFMANLIAGGPMDGVPGKRALGVAPGARVVVVKVADERGVTSLSQVLAGMDWVAAQAPKIQVVNIALSHQRPGDAYGADPLTAAVEHLVDGGLVVVAAAGNNPRQVGDPGLAPQALTVGAADLGTGDGGADVADFSGTANVTGVRKPDLVASGVGLLSILPARSVLARQHPDALQDNGFYRGSGTSESTAVASGAVAVLLSSHPDARLTDVKPALRVAADDIKDGRGQGQGLLDLSHALRDLKHYTRHGGDDASGEDALNTSAWKANSWQHGAWEKWLSRAWSANSWAASSWAANSWSANSWAGNNWTANSWSANSWSASSWAANSWSGNNWTASSWAANSWAGNNWTASSWAANSWADQTWGDDA